jgi:hypothetical protein
MNKQLISEDRRAVDLLLDRGHVSCDGKPGVYLSPGEVAPQRAQSLEKILSLLQLIPVDEPPADLTGKTMLRIDEALAQLRAAGADNSNQLRPML